MSACATAILLLCLITCHTVRGGGNVLVIIADDYGVDSQSLYNTSPGTTPPTPNINALAASGVRFTNAWACPVCSPTRACLLTGRYGFRTGVGEAVSAAAANGLMASETTLPETIAASASNIKTACFGKWHLSVGPPATFVNEPNTIGGWQHYAGATGGSLASYTSWSKITNGVTSTNTTYATTDVVNDAVAWITARNAVGEPWLAWVAFNAPHTPFHNPPSSLHSYGTNPATNLLKYRAAVESMDTEIGRLLLSVNFATTTVIFISDNGTPAGVIQAPWDSTHAKDTLYEGGVRIPLIIRGPSVNSPGSTSTAFVHAVDLFSTQLALVDVALPTNVTLDSQSLLPVLANQTQGTRGRLFTEQFDQSDPTNGGRAIRDDRFKLIRLNTGSHQFFDLLTDPAEATNLLASGISAMSSEHQSRYYRLRYNLASYSAAVAAQPSSVQLQAAEFSLTVPVSANTSQTLWSSTDLNYWSPVSNSSSILTGTNLTFTAPATLDSRRFFSVLTE